MGPTFKNASFFNTHIFKSGHRQLFQPTDPAKLHNSDDKMNTCI